MNIAVFDNGAGNLHSLVKALEAPRRLVRLDIDLRTAYYANSYVCRPVDLSCVVAWGSHESDRFAAAVRVDNTLGAQFHPERSSAPSVAFIQRFLTDVTPG